MYCKKSFWARGMEDAHGRDKGKGMGREKEEEGRRLNVGSRRYLEKRKRKGVSRVVWGGG